MRPRIVNKVCLKNRIANLIARWKLINITNDVGTSQMLTARSNLCSGETLAWVSNKKQTWQKLSKISNSLFIHSAPYCLTLNSEIIYSVISLIKNDFIKCFASIFIDPQLMKVYGACV